MTDSSGSLPIAGWYPDPEDATQTRWWNGVGWSDHRKPAATATAAPTPPPAAPVVPVVPAATPEAANPYLAPANPYAAQPTPYATPAAGPYSAAPYAAAPATSNGIALAGFIVALVGLLLGIAAVVGLILSIVGFQRANRMIAAGNAVGSRRGLALAGIIIASVALLLSLLVGVANVADLTANF